jgi:hypothetical protein
MDESLDHEPTLIERGMGVHLNHPITARRGIRNSRPDRWELRQPHPPSRGGTARERSKQVEELAPIALNGPRLGGSTHGNTSYGAPNAGNACYVHVAPPRPAGTLPMPVETNTPHTGGSREKNPCRSTHAAARLRGLDPRVRWSGPTDWHQPPGGKNVPSASVSICGILTDTPIDTRGLLSGTAIRVP